MTKTSTVTARPGARRQQIIDVAAGLFAQRGYHGVSIADIGSALGLSGPALYKHFASKNALLAEMLVGISERLLEEAERRHQATAGQGPWVTLEALIGWHVEFALAYPALITVQFRDLANLDDADRSEVRHLQRSYVERWVGVIAAAVPTDEDRARAAAHAVFALINSTPHSARLGQPEMAAMLQRMALAALTAAAAPAGG